MATQQNTNQLELLQTEIQQLEKNLREKQEKLNQIHKTEIEKLVSQFIVEVEKAGFNKVEVKKLVNSKLTRKHKPRT